MANCPSCGAHDSHWMEHADIHRGALHEKLGIPEGHDIPAAKLESAEHSSDPAERKEASLAETFKRYRP